MVPDITSGVQSEHSGKYFNSFSFRDCDEYGLCSKTIRLTSMFSHNVLAKCIGTTNPINIVKATINGLRSVQSPQYVSNKRGKKLEHILGVENVKD